jgi:hypothetical protein
MRQRSSLLVTFCLCTAFVALPVTAQGPDRQGGHARFEFRNLWAGLVAWVARYDVTIDPNGLTVGQPTRSPETGGEIPSGHDAPAGVSPSVIEY